MTQYNTCNMKLSNSKISKLKSGMKNDTKVTSYQMWLIILMIRGIYHTNYYLLTHKFQVVIKPLRLMHQLI